MRRAVRAACLVWALSVTPGLAQEVTLLEKFGDWSAYAATGSPKVCFAVSKPKETTPKAVKRGPIFFYISRWPEDNVVNEVSVKMGYPFSPGAKTTVTIGGAKFELFTKDEGAFVEKPDMETKLVEAMKAGSTMKIQGKSSRGTNTSDVYSLKGLSEALERAAKECSG
ncbi:MAG TPA: invasion associated locus B family protein [Methyloceanibacter sp.]|nr:invasion associated locus B family protein [Methyloceanibacter sp.]